MKHPLRIVLALAVAIALGWGLSNLLAASPGGVRAANPAAEAWGGGWAKPEDLAQLAGVWKDKTPWGAPPVAPAAAAPPPPPPPLPVGVSKSGRNYTAIFQVNGTGVMQLHAGERLPDGGQVLQVAGRKVVWRDAGGKRQQREIFNEFQGEAATPSAPAQNR